MSQVVLERRHSPASSMEKLAGEALSDTSRRSLRDALGGFATGVTVILARKGDGYHGMTANSFAAVSLDPPLVLISIANSAKAAQIIHETRSFSINLLSKSQEAMSNHFAGRPSEDAAPAIDWLECGAPVLKDALGTFVCTLYGSNIAGDHTIFIGEIQSYRHNDEEPLLFFRGKYKRLLG